jgi:coenzyme F420 hydrogenase subunit beta
MKRSRNFQIDPEILSISFADKDLCCRCGTCVGVCPQDALSLDKDFFPIINLDKCDECGLCAKTCPGGGVNFKHLTKITFGHENLSTTFDGHVQQIFVGHAVDATIQSKGAGGGVATSILWNLLKNHIVDGCIVTRMNREKPWIGECFIARNHEDLLQSQGARYMIIPVNHILQQVRRREGKYAIVALPCQIHGIRLACEQDPVLKDRIRLIVGLFCGGSLEPVVVPELLKTKGLNTEAIQDFQFRGGKWPGKIRAILKSGRIVNMHYSNYKDGAYNYLIQLYMPKRCQTCIDGSNEFSDISVSDAWTRDKQGEYKFRKHSKILVRTLNGQKHLLSVIEDNALIVRDVSGDSSYQTHKLQTKRKGTNAPLRVARLQRHGKSAPIYDRPVPVATAREKQKEQLISLVLWLGQYKTLRYPLVKLLTSSFGIPFIIVREYIKKRKYRKLH